MAAWRRTREATVAPAMRPRRKPETFATKWIGPSAHWTCWTWIWPMRNYCVKNFWRWVLMRDFLNFERFSKVVFWLSKQRGTIVPRNPLSSSHFKWVCFSVADPDPDSSYLYVFGPPGSGSISQRCGSGSGSFYYRAKIERKTLIPTALWLLFDFIYLKDDVSVPSKSNKQKNFFLNWFFVGIFRVTDENGRIRIHFSEAWIRGSRSGSTTKCHGCVIVMLRSFF